MAWVKLDDNVTHNPKLLAAGPAASWLWVCAIAYCQRQLSDGFIPDSAYMQLGVNAEHKPLRLCHQLVRSGLFERVEGGYRVHDYLDHNASKSEVEQRRAQHHDKRVFAGKLGAEQRWRTHSKRVAQVLSRDSKTDSKSATGVDSKNSKRLANANSTDVAPSHPIDLSLKEQERDLRVDSTSAIGAASLSPSQQFKDARRDPFTDTSITERAARFIERYEQLYPEHRKGARYARKPARDYAAAVTLCETWPDDARLDKLAILFLTTNHRFAEEGSRTIPQFLALASWCDAQLVEWEAKRQGRA